MTEGKPYPSWPEADDRTVVEQMLRDSPVQWYACQDFVMRLVRYHAKNIAPNHWEDIMQDAMARIHKSLSTFKYECSLKTWLFGIVRNCIIDDYRKTKRTKLFTTSLDELNDDPEHEGSTVVASMSSTVEDECVTRDELDKAVLALREYVSTHAKPARNKQILEIVLFEGRSLEEAAKVVGCSDRRLCVVSSLTKFTGAA